LELVAQCVDQPPPNDEILRHRLGGATGLRHDEKERSSKLDSAEKLGHRHRVNILQHVESREVLARLVAELVPPRRAQCRPKRDGTECGATNAEHDNVAERLPGSLGELTNLLRALVRTGEIEETELATSAAFVEDRHGARERVTRTLQRSERNSAGHVLGEHVRVVEPKRHVSRSGW
jgi:hypothetical protein